MMGNIIFKIDENGDRISENWTGRFYDNNTPDNIWIYINDYNGKNVPLKKGDRICFSDGEIPNNGNYEIVEAQNGIYQVKCL